MTKQIAPAKHWVFVDFNVSEERIKRWHQEPSIESLIMHSHTECGIAYLHGRFVLRKKGRCLKLPDAFFKNTSSRDYDHFMFNKETPVDIAAYYKARDLAKYK